MSKMLRYSFLVVISLTMWRSPVASAWVPSPSRTTTTTTTTTTTLSSTLLHLHRSADRSDAGRNDADNARRRFLLQNTMRLLAASATTTLLTTAAVAKDDETIQNQRSSGSSINTDRDTLATPPKWPETESPLPSPWTDMSPPTSFDDDYSNGAAEGATDFSRAMQKAGKQKQVDPRTHG
jgi:hypothetical protein